MILPGDFSQMWFIDGKNSEDTTLTPEEIIAIREFVGMSRGMAVLSSYGPNFQVDANLIAEGWDVSFNGLRDHSEGLSHTCNPAVVFSEHPTAGDLINLFVTRQEGRVSYTGSPVFFDVISTFRGDTLQATYSRGFERVFFDCCFERYLTSLIWGCGGDTMVHDIA